MTKVTVGSPNVPCSSIIVEDVTLLYAFDESLLTNYKAVGDNVDWIVDGTSLDDREQDTLDFLTVQARVMSKHRQI